MNTKEIQVKKLILKFSKQYYEMENSVLFGEYSNYCKDVTRTYMSKLNIANRENNLIINIHNLFCENNNKYRHIKPTNFLNCGLDFNDDELLEYFKDL